MTWSTRHSSGRAGGAAALAAVTLLSACGPGDDPPPGGTAAQAAEGAASDAVSMPALATDDVAYLSRLGLIRGHLHVGMQLYEKGRFVHAKSHMKHPGDELYSALEPAFAARGAAGFSAELAALATAVESEAEVGVVDAAHEALREALARAESRVGEGVGKDAAAQTAVVVKLLETAAEEYGAGVDGEGRVVDAHEYQDAYGFTVVAGERARTARTRVEDPAAREALGKIAAEIESLSGMWPALVPGEAIGATPADLRDALARIRTAVDGI